MVAFNEFVEAWKQSFGTKQQQLDEFPDYTNNNLDCLITSSRPLSFQVGIGASIYTSSLLPAIREAQHEVVLVTCFWAPSSSLAALKETLEHLAQLRKRQAVNGIAAPLKIRIGLSSRSFFQKLFHPASKDGYVYPSSAWPGLGLPTREVLEAGIINLQVKSLFFLPFSVMHPKFVIIDRKRVFMPSCNVSWESWLEGCVELSGDAVAALCHFYRNVWDKDYRNEVWQNEGRRIAGVAGSGLASINSPARRFAALPAMTVPTILLPSSHHRNPCFRLLPWSASPTPPSTPLNMALLQLFDMAERSIYIQTPNLTSASVIDAIIGAVQRGVDVTVVTSKRMMLIEQIVTAGTTNALSLRRLFTRYRALSRMPSSVDVEAQRPKTGKLKVSYFHSAAFSQGEVEEPVHSHIKLTIVDDQYTVLGSGNMDRASWFTSQELGVLFYSAEFAKTVTSIMAEVLENRITTIFGPTS